MGSKIEELIYKQISEILNIIKKEPILKIIYK